MSLMKSEGTTVAREKERVRQKLRNPNSAGADGSKVQMDCSYKTERVLPSDN